MAETVQVNARDLARLQTALRRVDRQASADLTRRMRRIAQPLADDVRRAALALPSNTGSKHSLRAGIAKSVELRVGRPTKGAFARIRVSGSKFNKITGKYRKIPRYVEGLSKRPWRRPAHAPKGVRNGAYTGRWIVQQPKPYLLPTVLPKSPQVARALTNEYLDTFETVFRSEGL